MHTAVAELVQLDASGRTGVEIRVFADDFGKAVALHPGSADADSAMARYLRGTFAIADRFGRPVRLTWLSAEARGDVVLLRLRGDVVGGLAGSRVTSLVLCERFEDQVNVVRAVYGGTTETLLFSRGAEAKLLP